MSKSAEKVHKCKCGRVCLTSQQAELHKYYCDEHDEEEYQVVSEDRCALWRKLLPTYDSAREMVEDIDYCENTLRTHLSGRCDHEGLEFYWEYTGGYWEARQK